MRAEQMRTGASAARLRKPAEIEAESMRIIDDELQKRGVVLTGDTAPLIRRVVHTTADFDYVDNLIFSPEAVSRGIEALRRGEDIVTDTNMARTGISWPGLSKLGGEAVCFMADPDVAAAAKTQGITRAAAAVDKASALYPTSVYVSGNAPTALFALAERIRAGLRPSLVIGVPVGFVNVEEAKEEMLACCEEYGVPCIVARGRKGGSNVAAALCNALIYAATDELDPHRRNMEP